MLLIKLLSFFLALVFLLDAGNSAAEDRPTYQYSYQHADLVVIAKAPKSLADCNSDSGQTSLTVLSVLKGKLESNDLVVNCYGGCSKIWKSQGEFAAYLWKDKAGTYSCGYPSALALREGKAGIRGKTVQKDELNDLLSNSVQTDF